MDNKEVEKKIEKSVQDIKTRKFSEVWKEIEPELKPKKKGHIFKMIVPVAASACMILTAAITIPFALRKSAGEIYFIDQLEMTSVQEENFYNEIGNAKIKCVDFSRYYVESYVLLKTGNFKVKGGLLDVADDEDNPTMLMTVMFVDSSVRVKNELYADYALTYSVNGATINYKLGQHLGEGEEETYEYLIKATQHKVTYLISYISFSDNVTEFFNEFFE